MPFELSRLDLKLDPLGQLISKCLFLCLQFLPKNHSHSSKNEFICSVFFGRIHGLTICFRNELTFTTSKGVKKNLEGAKYLQTWNESSSHVENVFEETIKLAIEEEKKKMIHFFDKNK